MKTEEILKQSTPRPWKVGWKHTLPRKDEHSCGCECSHHHPSGIYITTDTAREAVVVMGGHSGWMAPQTVGVKSESDATLIVLAVNSYERQRECIRELMGFLTELQDVLNAKEFNSLASGLNAAIARAKELL